jgi:hypothetical protein
VVSLVDTLKSFLSCGHVWLPIPFQYEVSGLTGSLAGGTVADLRIGWENNPWLPGKIVPSLFTQSADNLHTTYINILNPLNVESSLNC